MVVRLLIKQSLSWVIILTLLPPLLGTGLVHHHCITCNNNQTEATLFLMPHDHPPETCGIEMGEDEPLEACSTRDNSHEHHRHQCHVDFYLLNIPSQLTQVRKLVPSLYSLQCLFYTSLFHNPLHPQESPLLTQACSAIPPFMERYQSLQRLSKNAVFRL